MSSSTIDASSSSAAPRLGWLARLKTLLTHFWMDEADTRRLIPASLAQELTQRMAAGEAGHGGELRLCVEAALPSSYLWRVLRSGEVPAVVRSRARMMFGKLGVWDTEHNSGVLLYVLLAEHAIEVVADRGLRHIPESAWQAIAHDLAQAFRAGHPREGLLQALDQCEALLQGTGLASDGVNELPDAPLLQ